MYPQQVSLGNLATRLRLVGRSQYVDLQSNTRRGDTVIACLQELHARISTFHEQNIIKVLKLSRDHGTC